MDFPYGETVTRLRAVSSVDEYHNAVEDWTTPNSLAIEGVAVGLGGSFDITIPGRDATESDYDLILPIGSDVLPTDRLEVRGEECDIIGRPFDWSNPFTGWQPGMVVRASVREG
jgi:hypothetical protein